MTYSIIQKSQLEGAKRVDAEYYQPEYLNLLNQLKKIQLLELDKITTKIDVGFVSSMVSHFKEEGIPLLRTQNVNEFFIDLTNDLIFIDKEFHQKLKKSQVFPGDVLLARSGSIGNASVVPSNFPIANSADIILIKTNKILPEYLSAFLNSRYGQFQIERGVSGGLQGHINLYSLEKLLIPIIDNGFQETIKKIVLSGLNKLDNSKSFYSQAENLLLRELGLVNFKFKDDLFFVVDSSKAKDRIDADYFQPKYEQLTEKLKLFKAKKLEEYISNYSTGFTFKSDNYQEKGIPLIRINNIKKGLIDLSDTAYLSEKDFLLSPKDEAKSGDIVLSMSGSIGLTAMIPPEIPKCSVNQRILKFTSKNINKECLVLILNSIVGNLQLERIGTGGVQTNISYNDIKNVLIPELETNIQEKIADLIKKSHEMRKKSKDLLEEAKRKVEEMIERGDFAII